tara:strand:+ start:2266 stop:3039 length:774 start_codon:yes stop_codon:yes gene_type:complete
MTDEIKFPYQDFYYADWRMGCSGMTAQQEGLYIRLYTHLGTANGKGLPNDFNFIYRMVADPSEDAEVVQHQKEDLMWVITHKLALVDGRYHQLVQKKRREDKVDIVKIRQESGKKGGQANSKLKSSKPSDSESISIYNNIWEKLSIKRGSKSVALRSWLKVAIDIKPEILIEKYNALCSQADDPKFIPHFATWLNHERWEEELPTAKEEQTGFAPQRDHKNYVNFVKRGQHTTFIDKEMVTKMLKDNLITQEEHDRW